MSCYRCGYNAARMEQPNGRDTAGGGGTASQNGNGAALSTSTNNISDRRRNTQDDKTGIVALCGGLAFGAGAGSIVNFADGEPFWGYLLGAFAVLCAAGLIISLGVSIPKKPAVAVFATIAGVTAAAILPYAYNINDFGMIMQGWFAAGIAVLCAAGLLCDKLRGYKPRMIKLPV